MNNGEAPGRPPGTDPKFIVDGWAAASIMITLNSEKEKAMKTAIVVVFLALTLLLGPQPIVTGDIPASANDQVALNVAAQSQSTTQPLNQAEMGAAVGGGLLGCASGKDASGDTHEICCFSLWIFSVCIDVNISAVERIIDSFI